MDIGIGEEYSNFVRKHPDFDEKTYNKEILKKIAKEFMKQKKVKISKGPKCYWLVLCCDDDRRGDYSLVYCRSKDEAIILAAIEKDTFPSRLYAEEIDFLITIDSIHHFLK